MSELSVNRIPATRPNRHDSQFAAQDSGFKIFNLNKIKTIEIEFDVPSRIIELFQNIYIQFSLSQRFCQKKSTKTILGFAVWAIWLQLNFNKSK